MYFKLSAQINELNLNHINKLKQYCPIVGYSDHSIGKIASISSVAMGAKVIEKHFILNKKIKSADEKFSIFSNDFFDFVKKIRITEKMLGKIEVDKKKILKNKLTTVLEIASKVLNKNQKIIRSDLASVRPE